MEKIFEIMEKDLLEIDVSLTEIIVQENSEGIDRLFKDCMATQSKIEELICDSHYIEWLDQFTKKYGNIDDYSWMAYRSNIIGDDDKKLIDNLYYFYIGIRQYATLINIESRGYYIIFNDFCFHIDRYPDGNHTKTSVWRYKQFKPEDYLDKRFHIIDFNEIISNFRQYKSAQVSKQLCILSSLAKAIHKNGVPAETIVCAVDTEFSKIKRFHELMSEYYSKSTELLTLQEIFERAGEKDFFNNLSIEEIQRLIDDTDEQSKLRYIFENIKRQKEIEKETQESIKILKLKK